MFFVACTFFGSFGPDASTRPLLITLVVSAHEQERTRHTTYCVTPIRTLDALHTCFHKPWTKSSSRRRTEGLGRLLVLSLRSVFQRRARVLVFLFQVSTCVYFGSQAPFLQYETCSATLCHAVDMMWSDLIITQLIRALVCSDLDGDAGEGSGGGARGPRCDAQEGEKPVCWNNANGGRAQFIIYIFLNPLTGGTSFFSLFCTRDLYRGR